MPVSWSQLKAKTKISGTPLTYSAIDCARCADKIGLSALPPTYIEYVSIFGIGRWTSDFIIAVPHHRYPALTVFYRTGLFKECVKNLMSRFPNDHDFNGLGKLLCFGGSGDGNMICWNTQKISSSGEMEICMVTADEFSIHSCGQDLLEFLDDYWIGQKINDACPLLGSWESKSEFTVLDKSQCE